MPIPHSSITSIVPGKITFMATMPVGTNTIVFRAEGYEDATVTQIVKATPQP